MGSPKYGNARHAAVHGPAIEDAPAVSNGDVGTAAGATPTDAEFDALVDQFNNLEGEYNDLVVKFNALLSACRSANIIA